MPQAKRNVEVDIIQRGCTSSPFPKSIHGMAALDSLDSGLWKGKYLQKIALPLTGMDNKEQGM